MPTPWFNPIFAQIGPVQIHWYGLMYAVTFGLSYCYLHWSRHGKSLPLSRDQKDLMLAFVIAGVLVGGRLGYIIFYNLTYYLQNPLKILAVWEGGMSFHGGLIGAMVMLALFARRKDVRDLRMGLVPAAGGAGQDGVRFGTRFLMLSDVVTAFAPVGIFLVRIGNFINGELYGRVAHGSEAGGFLSAVCLRFPADPAYCRYPSQLFEAVLEGLVLFVVLWVIRMRGNRAGRKMMPGVVSSAFLIFYGLFRITAEFFREPDAQIGFLPGGVTEGQLLSGAMTAAGVVVWILLVKKPTKK